MLGTLGTLGSLPSRSALLLLLLSLALRLRFSVDLDDWAGDAVIWPAGSPFGESLGLEGFEEE